MWPCRSGTRCPETPATASGLAAAALTDLPVRLHLLTLSPDTPPVLLRAEYPMSTQVWNSVEKSAMPTARPCAMRN